jgi:hypothetical protein
LDYVGNLLIRGVVGAVIVVIVTYAADRFGPRIGGFLSVFPSISATSLIIIALIHGTSFASEASLSTLFGLAGIYFFIITIYYGYIHYIRNKVVRKIILLFIFAFIIYGITVFAYLAIVSEGTIYNVVPLIIGFIFARFVITNVKVDESLNEVYRAKSVEHLARAGLGGGFIVFATVMADLFGPLYGGIFSSFPSTIASYLIVLAITHSELFLIRTIKYMRSALLATGIYVIGVWYTYPLYGIVIGTLISYLAYTVALISLSAVDKNIKT